MPYDYEELNDGQDRRATSNFCVRRLSPEFVLTDFCIENESSLLHCEFSRILMSHVESIALNTHQYQMNEFSRGSFGIFEEATSLLSSTRNRPE
jgi:hypothetical protein